jgi:hypothetical protein
MTTEFDCAVNRDLEVTHREKRLAEAHNPLPKGFLEVSLS